MTWETQSEKRCTGYLEERLSHILRQPFFLNESFFSRCVRFVGLKPSVYINKKLYFREIQVFVGLKSIFTSTNLTQVKSHVT